MYKNDPDFRRERRFLPKIAYGKVRFVDERPVYLE